MASLIDKIKAWLSQPNQSSAADVADTTDELVDKVSQEFSGDDSDAGDSDD